MAAVLCLSPWLNEATEVHLPTMCKVCEEQDELFRFVPGSVPCSNWAVFKTLGWLMTIEDYTITIIQRTGNPVPNQPGFNGMIKGFEHLKCPQLSPLRTGVASWSLHVAAQESPWTELATAGRLGAAGGIRSACPLGSLRMGSVAWSQFLSQENPGRVRFLNVFKVSHENLRPMRRVSHC